MSLPAALRRHVRTGHSLQRLLLCLPPPQHSQQQPAPARGHTGCHAERQVSAVGRRARLRRLLPVRAGQLCSAEEFLRPGAGLVPRHAVAVHRHRHTLWTRRRHIRGWSPTEGGCF